MMVQLCTKLVLVANSMCEWFALDADTSFTCSALSHVGNGVAFVHIVGTTAAYICGAFWTLSATKTSRQQQLAAVLAVNCLHDHGLLGLAKGTDHPQHRRGEMGVLLMSLPHP